MWEISRPVQRRALRYRCCGGVVQAGTVEAVCDRILARWEGKRVTLAAPLPELPSAPAARRSGSRGTGLLLGFFSTFFGLGPRGWSPWAGFGLLRFTLGRFLRTGFRFFFGFFAKLALAGLALGGLALPFGG